jgi:hypothetical protein
MKKTKTIIIKILIKLKKKIKKKLYVNAVVRLQRKKTTCRSTKEI